MMKEDRKQLQVVLPRANGVSSALWPASARRCIATSKEAQRRRYMIINGKKWMLTPLFLIIFVTMAMSAAFVAVLSWHLWFLLPVVALLLVLLNVRTGMDARAIYSRLPGRARLSHAVYSKKTVTTSATGSKIVRKVMRPQVQPAPRTPMPELPLVRILETVDLSRSSIEHFVDEEGKERQGQDTGELLLNLTPAENTH
ncbi:MAG TPA: hypothetical protein VKV40_20355 [Ktedonobacteraceae bacterium]|nr:hypothetical protein [Ktedonobacteraceae bacterium]